jgi:SAM-dependent methyltransferase
MTRRRWTEIVHRLRQREIEIIFSGCPEGCFTTGLELGAGDGFQSNLLIHYVKSLISTDYNRSRLALAGSEKVRYLVCDAEKVDRIFRPSSFDLVFSSNLMEHLPEPNLAFKGIHRVLKDDGVCISVMPNPFMKLMWMLFFYPYKFMRVIEVLGDRSAPSNKASREGLGDRTRRGERSSDNLAGVVLDNNPKRTPYSFLRRQLWPVPHGAYSSNLEEFVKYRLARWVHLIEDNDFDVIQIFKMPVTTGYGFGFERLRGWIERLGFASGYAYVAIKKDSHSHFREYWPGQ